MAPGNEKAKPRKIKWLIVAVLVVIVAAVGYCAYLVHRVVTVDVPNAYAVDWVSSMVVEYMRTHRDGWPRSWDDLREPYEKLARAQNYPWSFEGLKERVVVDWNAEPAKLRKAETMDNLPPFRVIWLKDGSETHWGHAEPNRVIHDYLRGQLEADLSQ